MAGDWIKMRGDLWTHPKFIALSNMLIYCGEGDNIGMLVYSCGLDALELDVFPPSNKNVTDKALRGVTKKALRDVTMCALLRVWCAVNSHCKVSGNDAICSPMNLDDLDEIAGFDGFGDALAVVGWVINDEPSDSLIFPNFVEYNEPAILRRKPAKTNAERQAEFRQRKAEKEGVTKSNESNAREEKRRINSNTCDDSHFDEFWKAYPNVRKVAKKNCLAKWKAKKLDLIAEKIISDVRAKSDSWGEYAPAPLTYINQERWNDDPPQSSTPRNYL